MSAQDLKPEFAELVNAHAREIHAFLWRLLRDQSDSEDCLQSVFLNAFRAYGRMPVGANYRAWLYTIASNQARTLLKRRARDPIELADDLASPAARFKVKASPSPIITTPLDVQRWRRISREGLHPVNRDELDRILAKLEKSGSGSLTPDEKAFLDRFSKGEPN